MPRRMNGTLVTCEPALIEYVKHLDKEDHFIIKELDATHLLIDPSGVARVEQGMKELIESNTFVLAEDNNGKKSKKAKKPRTK